MENSCRCDVCNIDNHRASKQKHLRSKNHLENEKQYDRLYQNGYLKKSKQLLRNKKSI